MAFETTPPVIKNAVYGVQLRLGLYSHFVVIVLKGPEIYSLGMLLLGFEVTAAVE